MIIGAGVDQFRVGVFGAAFHWSGERVEQLARSIGEGIARRGHVTITGATTGLPYVAGKAAMAAGGIVLGISPAKSAAEHVEKYLKPLDGCSYIFYTGQGYTGRNYLNLRNCDAAVFIGGEAGTLEEFCIGVYEGLILGVLTNSGGICELLPQIAECFHTTHGEEVRFSDDPIVLLDELVSIALNKQSLRSLG